MLTIFSVDLIVKMIEWFLIDVLLSYDLTTYPQVFP